MVVPFLLLASSPPQLSGQSLEIYQRAMGGRWFSESQKLGLEFVDFSNHIGYCTVYRTTPKPEKWIVSLPGREGFAADEAAIWSRHLRGRKVGLISVQWWVGEGNRTSDYLTPLQINKEVDQVLDKVGAKPGKVMLHGFSRGSANSYPLAAIDAGKGKHWYSLIVASSGGVGRDYPPVLALERGEYGKDPLKGTKWITCAGLKDQNQARDGYEGMRAAGAWLKEQGAEVVLAIEDPNWGHGALVLNPANAQRVLDLFFGS